jgi:NosR/NirI family transcriptional regulator, nitrous oxide reductase regulator
MSLFHRTTLAALLVAAATLTLAGRQSAPIDGRQLARLKTLFPDAASFSPKQGQPPRFTAYSAGTQNEASTLGYAFWTTDLAPLERGYSGPIAILVGMNLQGRLTGIVVGDHIEPYGNFSIDLPSFAAQFRNKDVRDPFRLGEDIDAVSRATITMASAVRGVRNSSRLVARSVLTPPGKKP